MKKEPILNINIPRLKLFKSGKVREVFDLDRDLLIVSTDRISAFDVIMSTGIPDKGRILTGLSNFWFNYTSSIIENHVISTDINDFPAEAKKYRAVLAGRSMLVKKTELIEIECVVRGYLAGSGWKEYKESGIVSGIELPKGLLESSELPEPIFTPSIKAKSGHDENISEKKMIDLIGSEAGRVLKEKSIEIYRVATKYAEGNGIIIADTKFEFGYLGKDIILIDEILTPDSSRFWPKDDYAPGRSQKSFDKQYLRDYLETLDWDKTPPGPKLPHEIVARTREKYLEAYRRIVGKELN